jgi:hypothetical protein
MAADTHTELEELARLVARLSPDHRDPERYHLEKDAIRSRLRALARSPVVVRNVVRFVQAAPPGQGAPVVRSHDDTAPTLAAAALAPRFDAVTSCDGVVPRDRAAGPARKRPSRRHRFPMPPTSGERGLL